jgi:hypothetical protein
LPVAVVRGDLGWRGRGGWPKEAETRASNSSGSHSALQELSRATGRPAVRTGSWWCPLPAGPGDLDDADYPAYTTGRAAEVLGVRQAFLRLLDAAR